MAINKIRKTKANATELLSLANAKTGRDDTSLNDAVTSLMENCGEEYDGLVEIVNVDGDASAYLQEKTVDITANGTIEVTPDEGHALSKVTANVNVVAGGDVEWINDGNTHIWISLPEGKTSPVLAVCPKGTVTVDWGDGTTPDVLTGSSISTAQYTPTHNYASAGDYIITLTVDGEMGFTTSSFGNALLMHPNNDAHGRVYKHAIRKVEVGNGITSIPSDAFFECYRLTNVTIPDSVTSIGTSAFSSCYNLTNIVIPDGVTSIVSDIFKNCYNLTNVTIPDSVTSIGTSAFNSCHNLTNVTIPDSVTSIGSNAFNSCLNLTNVTIPDSVTIIMSDIFKSCYNLTNVTIPDSVTSIGNWAFNKCYQLANIVIPNSVTSIGNYAFQNCYNLTNVTIPESITSIGTYAFGSCRGLTKMRFEGTNPPSVASSGVFFSLPADCIISVPVGSLEAYTTATNYPSAETYTYVEE